MADRRFRQDVGDYMNDQEYQAHLAKMEALKPQINPQIQDLAQSYRNDPMSGGPMNQMEQDIAKVPDNSAQRMAQQMEVLKSMGGIGSGLPETNDGVRPSDNYTNDGFAHGGKVKSKPRFNRMNARMGGPKATAELEASKDPQKFMEENKNMSISGKKGVAF